MKSVAGRARLIWGSSELEFLASGLLAGLVIATCCATVPVTFAKVAETEVLSLSTRTKVDAAEAWAVDGRIPPANAAPGGAIVVGKYAQTLPVEAADAAISFRFTPEGRLLEGGVLTVRPAVSTSGSGALAWVCGRAPAPPGFELVGRDRTDLPQDELMFACRGHK